ncbi:gibberellin-regulated protein 14-like [Papaver somniferum]|uniref:gibberellin-regulated protein 14-like n=1 Tax=Papaver somniferum TaxID=3469 RepID=UPI000E6F8BB8|nr:gibberellin-regulated protein 14-like [Papaver somniferum]
MGDHQRVPYQTPPSSPYLSPTFRSSDISPPKGGPPKSSQTDIRTHRTLSSSGPRVSSTKMGDPPKGSRYAVNRPLANPPTHHVEPTNVPPPSSHSAEPLSVQHLRSAAPTTMLPQKRVIPQSTASAKGLSPKGTAPKVDPSRNLPTKRKASDMSPPKKPSSSKPVGSDVALVIRSVLVGRKNVTFKHVDLEAFKVKYGLEAFDVNFYALMTILLMI